ncbi:MAG: hypothetical protein E6Q97_25190 [Desulfurellales bacterium]|nr:MAG: hypothetical protein E6Q97_25190 [Desulfurellales bacterium]
MYTEEHKRERNPILKSANGTQKLTEKQAKLYDDLESLKEKLADILRAIEEKPVFLKVKK